MRGTTSGGLAASGTMRRKGADRQWKRVAASAVQGDAVGYGSHEVRDLERRGEEDMMDLAVAANSSTSIWVGWRGWVAQFEAMRSAPVWSSHLTPDLSNEPAPPEAEETTAPGP
jgi:hypothetical protein